MIGEDRAAAVPPMTDHETIPDCRTIFCDALEIADATDRAAYLDAACAGNEELRGRVDELLCDRGELGGFLEPRAGVEPGNRAASEFDGLLAEDREGAVIDRFTLLRRIGEGGFGVVYEAEQIEPVKRVVALKIIKLGMDTKPGDCSLRSGASGPGA